MMRRRFGSSAVLQTDAYAAYGKLADPKRGGGPVTLAYFPRPTVE